jgi:hypothetical protein
MPRIGCGLVVLGVASLLGGAGCVLGPSSHEIFMKRALLNRAAYDLTCANGQLTIARLDDLTRVVDGCGRQGTYVEMCDAAETEVARRCTWLLNGAVRDVAQ